VLRSWGEIVSSELYYIFGFVNLAIAIFTIFLLLRRRIAAYFSKREKHFAENSNNASLIISSKEGERAKLLAELDDLTNNLDSRLDEVEKRGSLQGRKLLLTAEEMAERIVDYAAAKCSDLLVRKNVEIYLNTVDTSIALAKANIRDKMSKEEKKRFCQRALQGLQSALLLKSGGISGDV